MYLCTNVYVYSSLPTGRISLFLLTILFSTQPFSSHLPQSPFYVQYGAPCTDFVSCLLLDLSPSFLEQGTYYKD